MCTSYGRVIEDKKKEFALKAIAPLNPERYHIREIQIPDSENLNVKVNNQ